MKDSEFIRGKVPMTKEEVRSLSLAKLELYKAQSFLDIGAGTGSLSIEAAVLFPQLRVVAIEEKPAAVALIKANQNKFQTANLQVLEARAPIALDETFDAIFIGGTGGYLTEILSWSFEHLKPAGRLVLNFILLENMAAAEKWLSEKQWCFETVEVQIGKRTALGQGHYFKPHNPVFVMQAEKRKEGK